MDSGTEHKEHIPEKLKQAGRDLPFRVPENYFSTFQDRLMERLEQGQETAGEPAPKIIRMFRPYLRVAAMIAGVLIITLVGLRQIVPLNSQQGLSSFELSEIVDYYLVDYDEELLYQAILESDTEIEIRTLDGYEDEIIEYLDTEGIDYSLLLEEN